jgi:threonine dehydratase
VKAEVRPVSPEFNKPLSVDGQTLVKAIEAAYISNGSDVLRTPTIRLPWLDAPRRTVWAKLEFQQHSGSFKYRGALNALRRTQSSAIITASAGNHALATAMAGEKLGKTVEIITPVTASEIKIRGLMTQANVTMIGSDLYEATLAAKERTKQPSNTQGPGLHYLSPYADFDVVAGAGTVLPEAFADAGEFDYVFAPLGGGGLAAAVGAYCSFRSPSTRVVCTHPEIFGRDFFPGSGFSKQLSRPTEASLSDGLGVQLVEETSFTDILNRNVSKVVQVPENLIATLIAFFLRLQSLLVEGAAATTIAALIQDSAARIYQGNVLLLLTGGNISCECRCKSTCG